MRFAARLATTWGPHPYGVLATGLILVHAGALRRICAGQNVADAICESLAAESFLGVNSQTGALAECPLLGEPDMPEPRERMTP